MQKVKEGVEFMSTGWRLFTSVVLATIWITAFIYDLKGDIEKLKVTVEAYHIQTKNMSTQIVNLQEKLWQHERLGGHDVMDNRVTNLERRLNGR